MNNFKEKLFGLKGLASIGSSDIVGGGISAIFWFYLATLIEVEHYGEISYFIGIAATAQMISLFGTTNTLMVYSAKKIHIESTLYFISIIFGIICSIIIFVIFNRIDVSILVLGFIISELVNAVLLGNKFYKKYSIIILTQKILMVILGLGLFFNFGVEGVIFGIALSYTVYIKLIYDGFKKSKIEISQLKTRFGFVLNNYTMQLAGGFNGQIDKLIIAPLLGFELLGNYALALQFMMVLLLLPNIIFKFLVPHDASGNPNKNLKKVTVLVSIIIAVGGSILPPFVVPLFFPKFIEVIPAIQIMSYAVIPATISLILQSRLLGLEKSKFILFGSLIQLSITIIGMIMLGPIFGIYGIAFIYLIASSVRTLFLVFSNKIIS